MKAPRRHLLLSLAALCAIAALTGCVAGQSGSTDISTSSNIDSGDGNDIVLAFKNPAFAPRWREIANQAKALRARTGLDFPKFAQRFERNSRLRYL